MYNFRKINHEVMCDTMHQYENVPELITAVRESVERQYMLAQEDCIDITPVNHSETKYVVSGKRSFEAAKGYKGKKIAVLNFANNHSVGGSPFSAGAQEESLCRCSTLYPCLLAMKSVFYDKHRQQYENHEINYMGNDDLIYTPDVIVFKTDERTDPIRPELMPKDEWYKVDIITCAAPELWHGNQIPHDYAQQIHQRIKRILDVAAKEGVEVLILGKWGCGAFKNPLDVVAKTFMNLLKNYDFKNVEFALATNGDIHSDEFAQHLDIAIDTTKEQIISLLRSTNREYIDKVIGHLEKEGFFIAPASAVHHNNFEGGLAKHSLEVYHEAIKLNKEANLPVNSIILCSLLHDVCKMDQYTISSGQPERVEENIEKGHGRRSMFILKLKYQLPLNYDEEMAIWWHMGEHEKSKEWCPKEYEASKNIPLCTLIQKADGIATRNRD